MRPLFTKLDKIDATPPCKNSRKVADFCQKDCTTDNFYGIFLFSKREKKIRQDPAENKVENTENRAVTHLRR